jgi:cytosine/adenosine deaminase-related metal-dependent hydrolase
MSLHLAESEDEQEFIQSARGEWADFLTSRDIDFSRWPIPSKSPVTYLHALGVLDAGTLAVHLLQCSGDDMALLREKRVKVCFCPRSNYQLHGRLPDIPGFLALGFRPCLGTDSLASCPTLNIHDEMAFVMNKYNRVSPTDILAMGTVNGAVALGLGEAYGRLAPGCPAPPLYVPIWPALPATCLRPSFPQETR